MHLEGGEIVALIGPNGSGKSTLMKSVVGLAKVFSGRALHNGTDILGIGTDRLARMGIAYVPPAEQRLQAERLKGP